MLAALLTWGCPGTWGTSQLLAGEAPPPALAQIHGKTSFLLTFPVYPETRSPATLAPLSLLWDFGSGCGGTPTLPRSLRSCWDKGTGRVSRGERWDPSQISVPISGLNGAGRWWISASEPPTSSAISFQSFAEGNRTTTSLFQPLTCCVTVSMSLGLAEPSVASIRTLNTSALGTNSLEHLPTLEAAQPHALSYLNFSANYEEMSGQGGIIISVLRKNKYMQCDLPLRYSCQASGLRAPDSGTPRDNNLSSESPGNV